MDCQGFKEKTIEAGLEGVLLYIGGYLRVGKADDWGEVEQRFKTLGFDRVYPPGTLPEEAIEDLRKDSGDLAPSPSRGRVQFGDNKGDNRSRT